MQVKRDKSHSPRFMYDLLGNLEVAVKRERIFLLTLSSPTPSAHPCLTVSFSPAVSLQDDSSVSSEDMTSAEPTWVAAEQPPVPEPSPPNGERVSNPTATVKEEDGKTSLTGDTSLSLVVIGMMWFYLFFASEI